MRELSRQIIELVGRAEDQYREEHVAPALNIYRQKPWDVDTVRQRIVELQRLGMLDIDECGYVILTRYGRARYSLFRTRRLTTMRRIPLYSERRRASHT